MTQVAYVVELLQCRKSSKPNCDFCHSELQTGRIREAYQYKQVHEPLQPPACTQLEHGR